MDHGEFASGIKFKYIPPMMRRPWGFRAVNMFLRKFDIQLECWNTQLPCDQKRYEQRLRDVCRVPRMSTFAIGSIINRAVEQLPDDQSFVNIGVWNGFTFFSGLAGNSGRQCVGVDNFSHPNSPRTAFLERYEKFRGERHAFHEMGYHEYFANVHQGPIGFYLFDGPHTYQDQFDGLKLAEPHFAEGCLILIDDTNWSHVRQANLDFMAQSRDEYRILLDERTPKSGHPTFWNGVMLFQKVRSAKSAAA
jgi:hypothetical protein